MENEYIVELIEQFKKSIPQEETELVELFKNYLQNIVISIKNSESRFVNKDDESIKSVVTKMANDLIYGNIETKKRTLVEDKNLEKIAEYSEQAYNEAVSTVIGDSIKINYNIDERINETIHLLDLVAEYNKDIAKKLVSETVLDLEFIKNPKSEITSLRLGHFIADYKRNKEEER